MLNNAIKRKPKIFLNKPANSSIANICYKGLAPSQNIRVNTTSNKIKLDSSISSIFPESIATPPSYEWVSPLSGSSTYSSQIADFYVLLDISYDAISTSRENLDSVIQNTLMNVYELDKKKFNRLASQEIMLFVEKSLRSNNMTETNKILELADFTRLSSRSLIGLIRSTARLKDHLPAWKKAYQESRKQVVKEGKNPDTLFIGLPAI